MSAPVRAPDLHSSQLRSLTVRRVPIFTRPNSGSYKCPSASPRPSLVSTQVHMSALVGAPDLRSSQLRSVQVPQCKPHIFTCFNSGLYECPSASPRPSLVSTQVCMSAPVQATDIHSSQLRSIRVPQCEPKTFTHLNSGPYKCPSVSLRPSLVSTQVHTSAPSASPRPSLVSTQVSMSAPVRAPDLHSSQFRSIQVPQCEPKTFTHLNSGPYKCPSASPRPSLVSTHVRTSAPVRAPDLHMSQLRSLTVRRVPIFTHLNSGPYECPSVSLRPTLVSTQVTNCQEECQERCHIPNLL